MSSSTSLRDDDAPDLVCQIDCVHGMVDALSSVRWKRHQVRPWIFRSTVSRLLSIPGSAPES
jgi:hypothetical protein